MLAALAYKGVTQVKPIRAPAPENKKAPDHGVYTSTHAEIFTQPPVKFMGGTGCSFCMASPVASQSLHRHIIMAAGKAAKKYCSNKRLMEALLSRSEKKSLAWISQIILSSATYRPKTTVKQIAVAILALNSTDSFSLEKRTTAAFNRVFLVLLLLFTFIAEVLRVYLVMPFPGSQRGETVQVAYWISMHIGWIRLVTGIFLAVALIRVFKKGRTWEKMSLLLVTICYLSVFILFNYRFEADQIFHQPTNKSFIPVAASNDKTKLVIGVVVNGEAKAYPIQLIGYHHQVADTVGAEPVIITYCTVCRTGRVYSAVVNGHQESFRLVGMDHFNAVFEDKSTKSWWQQATGEAITGPLKGAMLKEIPSAQLTIDSWMRQYPDSKLMAPDSLYDERYFRLEDYDRGTMQSSLVRRDYRPWQPKSWVIGVKNEYASVAYDWNDLVQKRLIEDSLKNQPILLTMESDTTSFHVYDRRVNGAVLKFNVSSTDNRLLVDRNTHSTWNMDGLCVEGPLKGQQLTHVQAYNEFWHSWKNFQENATRFVSNP